MKTVVRTSYGEPGVIEVKEAEKPAPAHGEVLVRVHSASLNKADWYDLNPPFMIRMIGGAGVLHPKDPLLGRDLAGTVEQVGDGVTRFKAGDDVFGTGTSALSEFSIAKEGHLALKPSGVSFESCAASPIAGVTALQALRKAKVAAVNKVLVDGASGGVGTFAVQIAKSMGAEVTAVCSAQNLDNARSMGADTVIDYAKEDFTRNGKAYDVIVGVNGFHSVLSIKRALVPGGTFILVGSHRVLTALVQVALFGRLASGGGRKVMFLGIAKIVPEDLSTIGELMATGKLHPFIDKRFSQADASQAFRYVGEGHARGKAIVNIGPAD